MLMTTTRGQTELSLHVMSEAYLKLMYADLNQLVNIIFLGIRFGFFFILFLFPL